MKVVMKSVLLKDPNSLAMLKEELLSLTQEISNHKLEEVKSMHWRSINTHLFFPVCPLPVSITVRILGQMDL